MRSPPRVGNAPKGGHQKSSAAADLTSDGNETVVSSRAERSRALEMPLLGSALSGSCPHRRDGRVHLGSPAVPVNPPARYLRHRAAAERASRRQSRARRWRWLALTVSCVVGYFAIGRELVQVARGNARAVSMETSLEVKKLTRDLENISSAARSMSASEITSPIAFTSVAALVAADDSGDVDAWLSDDPVDIHSRVTLSDHLRR